MAPRSSFSTAVASARRRSAWSAWVATTTRSKVSRVVVRRADVDAVVVADRPPSPRWRGGRRAAGRPARRRRSPSRRPRCARSASPAARACRGGRGTGTGGGPGSRPRRGRRRTRRRRPGVARSAGRSSRRSPGREELAPGGVRLVGRLRLEQCPRRSVEARHLREHPQEPRDRRPGAAGPGRRASPRPPAYDRPQASQVMLMLISVGRVGTPSSREQAQQMGVGALVVHDEAAVDAQRPTVCGGDVVGVRVAAEARVGLEHGDVVGRGQHVGGGQAGHAGSDRRRPWGAPSLLGPGWLSHLLPFGAGVGSPALCSWPFTEGLSNVCLEVRSMHKVCQRFGETRGDRPHRHRRPARRRGVRLPRATSRPPSEWDPGTVRTTRESGDGGVGTTYHNVSRFLGRATELTYVVTEHEPPVLLRLRGENKTVVAHDTMTLVETPTGGTELTYRAEFSSRGWPGLSRRWRRRPSAGWATRPSAGSAPRWRPLLDSTNHVHDQARRGAHRGQLADPAGLGAAVRHRARRTGPRRATGSTTPRPCML